MPMMVFLVLGILQLGMMHHARLMSEYAAYRAVRSGIVNSGSCERMEESAIIALLPTLGPVGVGSLSLPGRTDTLPSAMTVLGAFKRLDWNDKKLTGTPLKVIQVDVLNPKKSQLDSLFNTYPVIGVTTGQTHREEIDFDDIRDARVIEANLLTVRVTYYYEMRVPIVNKFMHAWYIGLQYLKDLRGVQFDNQKAFGAIDETTYLEGQGALAGGIYQHMAFLANRPLAPVYVVPMVATYSMRMQSNLMKKHVQPCAVD